MTSNFKPRDMQTFSGDVIPASSDQGGDKQWSMSTLKAARPNPQFDTREKAENWNYRYAKYEVLQVNAADFPESFEEPDDFQVDRNYDRLTELTRAFNREFKQ